MNDPTNDRSLMDETLPPHHASVRAALSAIGRAPDDHRERAIAAALAVFDAHRSVPSLDAARAAKMSRLRRWNVALGAAAAVVLLGVVGTDLLRGMSGSDEESASRITVSAAADAVFTMSPSGVVPGSDQKAAEDAGQIESASTTAAVTSVVLVPTTTALVIIGPAYVTPAISSPEELLTLPESIPADPTLPTIEGAFACELMAGDRIIGRITYAGADSLAVRTVDGGVIAFDVDCAVLAEAKP